MKNVKEEYKKMNSSLLLWGGRPSANEKKLFSLMFTGLSFAVYGKSECDNDQLKHIEYLVNFSHTYLLRGELTVDILLKLHKNILPPSSEGSFIYAEETKREKVSPGKLRDIDTYIVSDGVEYDFTKHEMIEKELKIAISLYNASQKEVEDIVRLFLELNAIHPFRDGNGKTLRVLLEVLMIRSGFYPPLLAKAYLSQRKLFIKILKDYIKSDKKRAIEDFMHALLYHAYKQNYFSR